MAATDQELNLQIQARMLEALNSREQEFTTLTKLLDDIVFRCDKEGVIQLLNEAWSRSMGWSIDESVGQHLFHFQLDENWLDGFPVVDPDGDNTFSQEVHLLTRSGESRTFSLKATFVQDNWYGSLTDITNFRLAMSQLEASRERERKLSLVASRTDNLVIISDAQGAIEWVNESFEKETGYSLKQVKGRRPGDLLQGEKTSQETILQMREGLASGKGFNVEVINYNSEGMPYWVGVDCTPVFNEHDELINFIAVERIITERKESERALRDSEQHFRTILDTVSEAIFYCDSKLHMQYVNPAWGLMTGCDSTADSREELSNFVHCDDQDKLEVMRRQILTGATQIRREMRIISREGGWRHVELILSNIRKGNGPLEITGALIDIDERWHAARAMQMAKEKAEQLSEARTQFVANMSHEIRTPLNAIIGMSNVLRNTSLDREQSTYVNTLHNGGKALLALVNDILDLAKLDSEEMEFERDTYDLLDLTEQCIDVVSSAAEEKNLTLQLVLDRSVDREQVGDSHRLRQILLNLLSNAIKFTERGDVVLRIRQEDFEEGQCLRLQVQDTGIGIEADKLERLFDAFTQADASITRQFGGTGLGLSICKQIVDRLGGRIWAESCIGEGTTFFCDIPTVALENKDSKGCVHAYNLDEPLLSRVREMASISGYEFESSQDDAACGIALRELDGVFEERVDVNLGRVSSPRRLFDQLKKYKSEGEDCASVNQKPDRILIAEDVLPNQLVVTAMLKQLGYSDITVVENGRKALETARKESFDLALVDIHMPEMDGLSAARRLRSENLIPIMIAASADVTTEAREKAFCAGFDDILPKPFTRENLSDLLQSYLGEPLPALSKTA